MSRAKDIKKKILISLTAICLLLPIFSKAEPYSQNSQNETRPAEITSLRRNIATIIFCGLGGAVLGLSTLSFYGQPQEHISNISVGLALGLIGGTAYVTMQSTQSMKEQLSLNPVLELKAKSVKPNTAMYSWSWNF